MAMYYDATHPLLSDDALALSEEAREAQGQVAAKVLGLTDTDFEDEDATQAGNAVALQINYQVALPPEAWAIKRDKTGPLETEYRDAMPDVYPPAQAIVDVLLAEDDSSSGSGGAASGWNLMRPWR